MAFIEASDFSGFYKLPQDQYNQTITQNVISVVSHPLIRKIFGATLGNLIIDYIDNPPVIPVAEYDAVINSFEIDLECGEIIESIGLKDTVKGMIYWQRHVDIRLNIESVGGASRPKTENSNQDILPQSQLLQRYNKSVDSIRSIQRYICEHRSDYPDYNGQKFLLNYVI